MPVYDYPLQGVQVIEASAGTGKTYTLVNLCLRLVIEKALPLEQILVVTFTEAAAQELQDRIRQRLHLCLENIRSLQLDGSPLQTETDAFFQSWLPRIQQNPGLPRAEALLKEALASLDKAQISTIHAFCQRILKRFAFLCGQPFQSALIADQSKLILRACEDFWRREMYQDSETMPSWKTELIVHSNWTPASLAQLFRSWLGNPDLRMVPQIDDFSESDCTELWQEFAGLHQTLQGLWQQDQETIKREYTALKGGTTFQERYAEGRLNCLAAYLDQPRRLPDEKNDKLAFFSAQLIQQKNKGPQIEHPFFEQIDALLENTERLTALQNEYAIYWLTRCFKAVAANLKTSKVQQQAFSFDDLLTGLDQALQGPKGPELAAAIVQTFPAALIDEFQDTDPVQYRIFSKIYLDPEHDSSLFLIGDPKQSIYRFRGADIQTYLNARENIPASAHRTLLENYRSRPEVLSSLATFFDHPQPFKHPDIAYPPVTAALSESTWKAPQASALKIWCLPEPEQKINPKAKKSTPKAGSHNKGDLRRALPQLVATEIKALLENPDYGLFHKEWRPLNAGDVAVLVRTNQEGQSIRNTLEKHHIPAVLHSDESVFQSSEAADLQVLLTAVLHNQPHQILQALATGTLGLTASQIYAIRAQETALEGYLESFQNYRSLWFERGFASMWTAVLQGEDLYARLLSRAKGERALTNLRHLAELIQAESAQRASGPSQTLVWLQRQREQGGAPQAHQLLQLETDSETVQIFTIHKSKGLEFPVVICPYLWSAKRPNHTPPLSFRDPQSALESLDLGSEALEEHAILNDEAALQEDLRLLYVALTRARYLNIIVMGWVNDWQHSALSHLFPSESHAELMALLAQKSEQAQGSWQLEMVPRDVLSGADRSSGGPEILNTRSAPTKPEPVLEAAPPPFVPAPWRLSSFSSLSARLHPEFLNAELLNAELLNTDLGMSLLDDPAEAEPTDREPLVEGSEDAFMDFPRGGQHGTFLHLLLEKIRPGLEAEALKQKLSLYLRQCGYDLDDWLEILSQKLPQLWSTPLAEGLSLGSIRRQMLELDFHLPIEQALSAQSLNQIMLEWQPQWLPLEFKPVQGVLKGFIDLVFEHQGRYYVADYKSNYLGPLWSDYAPQNLDSVLHSHAYTLQAGLYLVALDRFLRSRITDYQTQTHLGGAYFLFLRGMSPDHPGNGIHLLQPPGSLIAALSKAFEKLEPAQ